MRKRNTMLMVNFLDPFCQILSQRGLQIWKVLWIAASCCFHPLTMLHFDDCQSFREPIFDCHIATTVQRSSEICSCAFRLPTSDISHLRCIFHIPVQYRTPLFNSCRPLKFQSPSVANLATAVLSPLFVELVLCTFHAENTFAVTVPQLVIDQKVLYSKQLSSLSGIHKKSSSITKSWRRSDFIAS